MARRKLPQLHAASELASLRVPPGNQLEAPQGEPQGAAQYSRQRSMARVLCLERRWRAPGWNCGLSL